MKQKSVIPVLLLTSTSFIWGLTFVTQKLAGYHMGAFTYNAVRHALAAVTLIPVYLIFDMLNKGRNSKSINSGTVSAQSADASAAAITPAVRRHTITAGLIGGSVLFIASNLQQFGIILNEDPGSASIAGFITGLYLIFTPILGLFIKKKASPVVWVSCIVAFAGLSLISLNPSDTGGLEMIRLSDGLLLIGAIFWAVHILLIDRYAHSVEPIRFTSVQFAVSSILSLISALGFETVSLQGIMDGIWPVLFGGVIACTVAYTLQIIGQRNVEPTKAAVIFSLESLIAAIAEAVWFGELMSMRKYAGGLIILLAILLTQVKLKRTALQ